MNSLKPQLPKISDEDRTPLVNVLLELIAWQQKEIDELKQALLKLKLNMKSSFGIYIHLYNPMLYWIYYLTKLIMKYP